MNIIISKISKHVLALLALAVWSLGVGVLASCADSDDDAPDNFYSSNKMTAGELIVNGGERFSQFRAILEKANYLSALKTYGEFTVFVPTNDAVNLYLAENGYGSVNDMPIAICDTIARTHIVNTQAVFTTDFDVNASPMNMNDRYIELSSGKDPNDNSLILYVNKKSRIVEKDDSVTNGVVHVIDHLLTATNHFLGDLISDDPTATIFAAALKKTGFGKNIAEYEDKTYSVSEDSITTGISVWFGTSSDPTKPKLQTGKFPRHRYFQFTGFIETDDVFAKRGIKSLEDLETYAKNIYDESFPEDKDVTDDPTDPRHPLYRFVAYHFIDRIGMYDQWVISNSSILENYLLEKADPEDYYEAMLDHSIMRFCFAANNLFINRKGVGSTAESGCKGVKVLKSVDTGDRVTQAKNGVYYYIDDVLTYDKNTRYNVLNRRMRIDGTTLCADFMNAGYRGNGAYMNKEGTIYLLKRGFHKNVKMSEQTTFGMHPEVAYWWSYQGNAVCVSGSYDISIKLPPVPFSGTWEIRMGYSCGDDRGAAQVYLNDVPCDIPVEFRTSYQENNGWQPDDPDDEEYNKSIDKAMRNLGFMKGPDCYGTGDAGSFRERGTTIRRILARVDLDYKGEYWLRFRQTLKNPDLYMSFDYLELCPKTVYDSPEGEDRH